MVVERKSDEEAPPAGEDIPHDHLFTVIGLSSSNLEKLAQETPSDFEEAISATGFGRFNVALMVCSLPGFWSAVSVTSSVSYIFSRAMCDLNLSMVDMGHLNAITYLGMISSAMVWGFLSDTLGRRRIMAWGFFCTGLVELAAGMSQTFTMMLVTRFFSGFLFNGPFAVQVSYIAEMHRRELRARVILLTSLFYTTASTSLPLLAWALLTRDWAVQLGPLVINSWNMYLLATAMGPLLAGLAYIYMPESPKFLMSRGRNEEAMKIFRKLYSMNMRKPEEEYPIKKLVAEKTEEQGRGITALRRGGAQFAPLFKPPHLKWLLLICLIHSGGMFGANTIRLWYPQLAAMIGSNANGSLCAAIAVQPAPALAEAACQPIETDMMVYLQSSVVGVGSALAYLIGGVIINKCGKKAVVSICGVAAAATVVLLPFLGRDAFSVAALVTATLGFTALFGGTLSTVVVDLFPTSLRVMAMATYLMHGRLGTIVGTVVFPVLMNYGCLAPFFTIAAVVCTCGVACCLLPNTTMRKLE